MDDVRVPLTAAAVPRSRRIVRNGVGRARWVAVRAVQPGVTVGADCVLGARSRVATPGGGRLRLGDAVVVREDFQCHVQGRCTIGDRVFINRWGYLSAFLDVSIGDDVRLGERVSIHDENHDLSDDGSGYLASPVRIGDGAWIGANVVVLPGARIGAGSVIAAGAVVRGEIPAYSLAAGVPARVVRALRSPS
jgi:maltose O-acetyltransferase